jgi:sulfide:quinone oxidoreductase
MTITAKQQIVVVGGGTAGITVAVIEPSGQHFYQPLWTLVGGTGQGAEHCAVTYAHKVLVVCPGIQLDWNSTDGLAEAAGTTVSRRTIGSTWPRARGTSSAIPDRDRRCS